MQRGGVGGEVAARLDLADGFAELVRKRSAITLEDWLAEAEESGCVEVRAFAAGVRRDEAAVRAAVTTAWSNGQVEGQVGRLKLVKRSGYLKAEERSPKTLAKYEKVFARVADLARRLDVADLSGVNLKFIDAYRRQRTEDGTAAKTRYVEAVIVRQLVNFARLRDMVAGDPLKGLRLKKPKPTPQPCWTY